MRKWRDGLGAVAESASTGCLSSTSGTSRRFCVNTACTTTLSDPIGAATYDHQPIGAIPRFRSEVGSRGVRASEGFSASTTTGGSRRDDILEPHRPPSGSWQTYSDPQSGQQFNVWEGHYV